jgi:beta-glucosidase-like glycosyl hydrolase/CubicO group peptidase (beta-lactamase class C family)
MHYRSLTVASLLLVFACSRAAAPAAEAPPVAPDPYAVLPPAEVHGASPKISIDSLLETLTVREKVGQLVMPWLLGNYAAFESEEYDTLAVWVDSLGVGGIIISLGQPFEVAAKLNALQRRARLPLLIAADLEWGSGMRLAGGTTFPHAMAFGATGRVEDAYDLARVTAAEARAVGIHLTFSPVADVNNNPGNPIINTRSFGEDPSAAAELVAAYVRGAREHGLFTTAKHFPGHGDTDTDSHIRLPVVRACWERLDTLELVPFRSAIEAGVTAVMTAHVALPCLTGDDAPATLSPQVITGVLRDSLDFKGLAVTDALTMGAIVERYGAGESAVLALLAGSDMVLMPNDARAAIEAVVAAVDSGRISEARLDTSVRRVLTLKYSAGLFARRTVRLDSVPTVVGSEDFKAIADDVAARSLTLVQPGPLERFRARRGPLAVVTYAEESNLTVGNRMIRELRRLGNSVTSFRLYPASGTLSYDSARALIAEHQEIVFAVSVRFLAWRGHVSLPDSLAALVLATDSVRPTVLASLGSPYLLAQLPGFGGAYLIAWSDAAATERAVAQALSGGAAITGRLPITLSEAHPVGFGVEVPPQRRLDLERLAAVTLFLEERSAEGAFPGGVFEVGHRGVVAYRSPVGHYAEDDLRPVSDTTVYDLASLTKVIGLTTAGMLLVADGALDLDRPVVDYVPGFSGAGKESVLVRHLLTHTSGLPAWEPIYDRAASKDEAVAMVLAADLVSPPGERYLYSDLGAITLTQVVEAVAGEPLDSYLERRVFGPLAMERTRFRPPRDWLEFIAPTEHDPWRGRLLHGEVHDENAARLGGVSGHAGLFSNAPDMARFALWLLDAWHDRLPPDADPYIPGEIVRGFTRLQPGPDGSTRALGWDTPTPSGGGSAGHLLSATAFGHTGFTGTSIWIDPERELFILLLTNRVHPTRENRAILRIRGDVADSVVEALLQPHE